MKKIIVIGIIVLFIGVGVQPAFAVESNVSADKIEKEEDCGCNPVDDVNLEDLQSELNKVDRLLNRVKIVTGLISIQSKDNPEIREKCNEIFEILNSDRPICDLIFDVWLAFAEIANQYYCEIIWGNLHYIFLLLPILVVYSLLSILHTALGCQMPWS